VKIIHDKQGEKPDDRVDDQDMAVLTTKIKRAKKMIATRIKRTMLAGVIGHPCYLSDNECINHS